MFCRHCGSEIPDNVMLCPNCGAPTEPPQQQESRPEPEPQQVPPRPFAQQEQAQQTQQTTMQRPMNGQSTQSSVGRIGGCGGRSLFMLIAFVLVAIIAIALLKGVFGAFSTISQASWIEDYGDDYYHTTENGGGYAITPHQLSTTTTSSSSQASSQSTSWGSSFFGGYGDVTTGTSNGSGIVGTNLNLPSFRDNYTRVYGNGQDVYTLMIYIVGSDLESGDGAASSDLKEIASATSGTNLNIIVQTGGTKRWWVSGIGAGKVQRWEIRDGKMMQLADLGRTNMASPDTLYDFIKFASSNYPANRYSLILWDHGGGSVAGYGWDEVYSSQHLDLSGINKALAASGIKFDFVGFDACLMGSVEVAYMLEPYADYLIASEETEPSSGWYYTKFVSALANDTSIDTVELGKIIIDSFSRTVTKSDTLSIVSLREIDYVYAALCNYMANASKELQTNYSTISNALASTVTFSGGNYDMFDLLDITNNCDIEGEDELIKAVESAVKYRNDCAVMSVYGLSCYFPYRQIRNYETARSIMNSFGYGDEIYAFYDSFTSIMGTGQYTFGGFSLSDLFSGYRSKGGDLAEDFTCEDEEAAESYDYASLNFDDLELQWSKPLKCYYLPLTEDDWSVINGVELQVILDNGECFLDMGSDQYWEEDDDGNLLLNYGTADNTWVAIDGQIVAYYAESVTETKDGYAFTGYVPALLNGTDEIELILKWDSADSEGYVAGYRAGNYGEEAAGKGLRQLAEGDTVEFLFDAYDYEGEYLGAASINDAITIGSEDLTVSYETVGDGDVIQCYMITDIYNNRFWTESVAFTD